MRAAAQDLRLTPSQVLRERREALARANAWKRLAVSVGCTLLCTLILFGLVFGPAAVHGSSMEPAFRENDLVLYYRLQRRYAAGDVVILQAEAEGLRADARGLRKVVKRVVGLPGDTVDVGPEGGVFINGELLEEPHARGATLRKEIPYPLRLGPGEYFVLGDNREHSMDSRAFGAVTAAQIKGRVLVVLRMKKP